MTLYLKYRPQTFADVVGQDHVVTTLEHAIERNQLSHAYLFCGSRGTGKTSVARILAKTMLTRGIEDEAIRRQIEKGVEDGSLVDLIEIDAASNRRIDDIRDLIERINFSPVAAKAKVYIIDEVHMLTKEAFNALLKTLEEPPDYAYFILATTELHKVPDTIQSRCQRFLFKRVKDDDIVRRLQYIVDQEHITIEREAIRAIARYSTGSFRDAISLLDQLRSLEKITVADLSERIGKTALGFIDDILAAIDAHDFKAVAAVVGKIEEANMALDQILSELLAVVRSRMHAAIDAGEGIERHVAMTDTILEALKDLRASPVPAVVVEAALLSLCGDQPLSPPASPSGMKHGGTTLEPKKAAKNRAESKPAASPSAKAETRNALIEAEELSIPAILKHWPAILEEVTPPSVRMSLKNGVVSGVAEDKLTLSFPSAFHRDKVAETAASRTIEQILERIFKRQVRLECHLEKDSMPAAATGPATDLLDAAEEVFGTRLT